MNLIQRDYNGIRKSIIQQQTVAMTVTYDIIKQLLNVILPFFYLGKNIGKEAIFQGRELLSLN